MLVESFCIARIVWPPHSERVQLAVDANVSNESNRKKPKEKTRKNKKQMDLIHIHHFSSTTTISTLVYGKTAII